MPQSISAPLRKPIDQLAVCWQHHQQCYCWDISKCSLGPDFTTSMYQLELTGNELAGHPAELSPGGTCHC